jgi:hypothetical protein
MQTISALLLHITFDIFSIGGSALAERVKKVLSSKPYGASSHRTAAPTSAACHPIEKEAL